MTCDFEERVVKSEEGAELQFEASAAGDKGRSIIHRRGSLLKARREEECRNAGLIYGAFRREAVACCGRGAAPQGRVASYRNGFFRNEF